MKKYNIQTKSMRKMKFYIQDSWIKKVKELDGPVPHFITGLLDMMKKNYVPS